MSTEQTSAAPSRAQRVLDWIAWLEHVSYVDSLCDAPSTAIAVFNCFDRSASAERGRFIEGVPTVGA